MSTIARKIKEYAAKYKQRSISPQEFKESVLQLIIENVNQDFDSEDVKIILTVLKHLEAKGLVSGEACIEIANYIQGRPVEPAPRASGEYEVEGAPAKTRRSIPGLGLILALVVVLGLAGGGYYGVFIYPKAQAESMVDSFIAGLGPAEQSHGPVAYSLLEKKLVVDQIRLAFAQGEKLEATSDRLEIQEPLGLDWRSLVGLGPKEAQSGAKKLLLMNLKLTKRKDGRSLSVGKLEMDAVRANEQPGAVDQALKQEQSSALLALFESGKISAENVNIVKPKDKQKVIAARADISGVKAGQLGMVGLTGLTARQGNETLFSLKTLGGLYSYKAKENTHIFRNITLASQGAKPVNLKLHGLELVDPDADAARLFFQVPEKDSPQSDQTDKPMAASLNLAGLRIDLPASGVSFSLGRFFLNQPRGGWHILTDKDRELIGQMLGPLKNDETLDMLPPGLPWFLTDKLELAGIRLEAVQPKDKTNFRLAVEKLALDGLSETGLKSMVFEGFNATGQGNGQDVSAAIASIRMDNFHVNKMLFEEFQKGERLLTNLNGAAGYDEFSLQNMVLGLPMVGDVAIESCLFKCPLPDPGKPILTTGVVEGVVFDFANLPPGPAKQAIIDFGYDKLVMNLDMSATLAPETGHMEIQNYSIDIKDAARLVMKGVMDGVGTGGMPTEDNPFAHMRDMSVSNLELAYVDKSLMGKLFTYIAGMQQMKAEDLKKVALEGIKEAEKEGFGGAPIDKNSPRELEKFVRDPKSLRVTLKTEKPFMFGELLANMAKQQSTMTGPPDVDKMLQGLTIVITANDMK